MKNLSFLLILFLFAFNGNAQEIIAKVEPNQIMSPPLAKKSLSLPAQVDDEIMLSHTKQAQIQLTKFASENINYPEAIKASGLEGQIIFDAWINTKGEIVNTKIIKSFNNSLNNMVIKALQNFKLSWPQDTSYLGARRLRVPLDFIME